MLFHDSRFLFFFFPVVFIGFICLGKLRHRSASIVWLIASSLLFYSIGTVAHLALLIGSILANYGIGIGLGNIKPIAKRKWALGVGIALNLIVLFVFKYYNFASSTLSSLFDLSINGHQLALPLAISFFTFQQIAYLVMVYRSGESEHSFIDYALYVSFFPQLIAGPIVQPHEMLPQLHQSNFGKPKTSAVALGLSLFCIGLGKKLLLADSLALIADPIFDRSSQGLDISTFEAWLGLLAFSFQIYFDFSAYSDMALGIGRCFGITLPENFASPYQSRSVVDFWKRWHITLSNFIKNYLYIPLGGNRHGFVRTYLNLLIAMALAGLWHGASWTFVLWGTLHGAFLWTNHIWRNSRIKLPSSLSWVLTFFAVTGAWVLFRSETLDAAINFYGALLAKGSIFPGGLGAFDYLLSLKHDPEWESLYYSIFYLDLYPNTINNLHLGQFFLSPTIQSLGILFTAALIALKFKRPLSWMTAPTNGTPNLNRKGSLLVAFVLVLLVLQTGGHQATQFIYFRF